MISRTKFLLMALSLTLISSPAFSQDNKTKLAAAQAHLSGIISSIEALQAADNSCERMSDCKVIVTGEQACGTPATYAAISTQSRNFESVKTLAEFAIDTRNEITITFKLPALCFTPSTPLAQCSNNVCILTNGH